MQPCSRRLRLLLALALVLPLLPAIGCTTNAATGRSQFNMISRADEIAIGEEAMPQLIEGYGGAVSDPALANYVTSIGMELALGAEEQYRDLPWEFTLLDSDVINAFALPGGKVFISRGLMARMSSEAQLAGVLGHEIGHVTAEHADQQMSRQMIIQGLAIGAAVAAGTQDDDRWAAAVPLAVSGAGIFNLKFGRDEELEADRLGMRYMVRSGYDPSELLKVMYILQEASGGAGQTEWLSTHPLPSTRIDRIENRLAGQYADIVNDSAYRTGERRFQDEILPMLRRYADAKPARPKTGAELALIEVREMGGGGCWCPGCAAASSPLASSSDD